MAICSTLQDRWTSWILSITYLIISLTWSCSSNNSKRKPKDRGNNFLKARTDQTIGRWPGNKSWRNSLKEMSRRILAPSDGVFKLKPKIRMINLQTLESYTPVGEVCIWDALHSDMTHVAWEAVVLRIPTLRCEPRTKSKRPQPNLLV